MTNCIDFAEGLYKRKNISKEIFKKIFKKMLSKIRTEIYDYTDYYNF